ncbi:IS66 family transposase [Novosphingobium jiangmenense]|uniref:IS66 family transposase n=1 Tax=Novosphingobium jiangmenense TaxID=2791981 RepID=A0ABS0HLQ0_9SPHN|nr:IS66 family transposase [Novosphingobium jiangmenense]MBF9153173.1 IS66 family transposase [Novosphingobium jiangmenense]
MAPPPLHVLSEAEKNELLLAQHEMIERMAARITELEGLVGKPRKTSSNSHIPPSKDDFGKKGGKGRKPKAGKRPPREGKHRPLAEAPDKTERVMASECGHCGTDVTGQVQQCRQRYDHVDLPPIRPVVTRVELWGGRCRCCGRRYKAQAPMGMAPGSPFGPGIRALMAYLHHSHHVGFERLSRIAGELFGLTISEGAIANMFRRLRTSMDAATTAIRARLLKARIIASDETTTRTNGVIQWQWVFLSSNAVLHKIASRRARSVAEDVLGQHRPDVWVSDRYSGQQELGREHQVCLAHVLRDVQYAIDSGDTAFAPHIRDHLRWVIKVGRRRDQLKDSTLAAYAAKADNILDRLVARPVAHPAGRVLLKQIKAWRGKFFVFLTNRDVPATNNISEREIRPSVVFRKVTNGFRSDWGAQIHAGYRSVTGTARLSGQSALSAIRDLVDGRFAVA